MELWNLIVNSNTFNFIIMILLLGILVKKLDVASWLEEIKEKISTRIEMSKSEREKANSALQKAKDTVANLEQELAENTELTKRNIEGAVKQTLQNAEHQAENILKNVETVVKNEEKLISSKILDAATKQALLNAEDKIIQKLKSNPKLHNKYIDEAIEDIDKVTL